MLKYFLEIKNRMFLLFITWVSAIFICYLYKEILLFLIVQSNTSANSPYNLTFLYFIFTNVTEIFYVYLQLIFFLSFQIFIFYSIYHLFLFFSPAFFQVEYFFAVFVLKIISVAWLISMALSNCVLIPLTWDFFLSFQELTTNYAFNLHFEAKLNEYLDFYISLYYLCFFYFQIFVFFFFYYLTIGLYNIKKFRKLYYYCFVIFATLISPPEILTQLLFSLFLIFTYELLLFIFLLKSNIIKVTS